MKITSLNPDTPVQSLESFSELVLPYKDMVYRGNDEIVADGTILPTLFRKKDLNDLDSYPKSLNFMNL